MLAFCENKVFCVSLSAEKGGGSDPGLVVLSVILTTLMIETGGPQVQCMLNN